jgi:hypothetical protein
MITCCRIAGAMLCMGLPKIWRQATVIRVSLVVTILLTITMAAWPLVHWENVD